MDEDELVIAESTPSFQLCPGKAGGAIENMYPTDVESMN